MYEIKALSKTADRECKVATVCSADQFETQALGVRNNRQCARTALCAEMVSICTDSAALQQIPSAESAKLARRESTVLSARERQEIVAENAKSALQTRSRQL